MDKQPDAADVPFSGNPSDTPCIKTGCDNMYVVRVWNKSHTKIKAIQPALGHTGRCESAQLEAIQRLFNRCLRHGDTTEMLYRELAGIGCGKPVMGGASSCPDAIARAIKMKVENEKLEAAK